MTPDEDYHPGESAAADDEARLSAGRDLSSVTIQSQ